MSEFIMAIDQGTTSSRVCLLNQAGSLVAQEGMPFRQIFPKPGWVEHDPEEIWMSVEKSIERLFSKNKFSAQQIKAIGITNQRETVVVWDRHTGKPVYNAIVWQCRRTQDICQKFKKYEKTISKKTGLVLDPYFSATKIMWILKNVPGAKDRAKQGDLLAGTIDSYLLWRLTSGQTHATDVSNASRTMLMNLSNLTWDEDLLKLFSIPKKMLPEIKASNSQFGFTKNLKIIPDGIVISGMAGDQQAALFGQACFSAGEVKCTYGTGSFILMNSGNKLIHSKSKLLTTVAWQLENQKPIYALEGGAFVCGAAVQWLRDGLKIISQSSEVEVLASQVQDSEGVEFVPALTGLGAPHWKPEARGIISGLTRGTTKAHLAFATLEAMALQNVDIINSMQKDLAKKIRVIKVDGGASKNNLLMQMQSNYSGVPVVRPKETETTVMGAAYLAGLGVGLWKNLDDIKKIWQKEKEFISEFSPSQRKSRWMRWNSALKKAF